MCQLKVLPCKLTDIGGQVDEPQHLEKKVPSLPDIMALGMYLWMVLLSQTIRLLNICCLLLLLLFREFRILCGSSLIFKYIGHMP